jgi:hypothetical protein
MGEAGRQKREKRLIEALQGTLGISMGIRIIPGPPTPMSPIVVAALWLAGYGLILAAVLNFSTHSPRGHGQIVSLLVWFGLYFAAGLYVSLSTTPKIFDTVTNDIIPHATDEYLDAVASDLERHFTVGRRIVVPLLAAAVSVVAAIWILGWDIKAEFRIPGGLYSWEMLLWGASYFLCFYSAAAGVVGGQFHLVFARHLPRVSERFYVLGAAETPIVKGLARLGAQMLLFWVLIFLAIASIMLVSVLPAGDYKVPATFSLLRWMVPISLFFSLGVGTLVYLASEASIRSSLQRFTARQAAGLQQRINALLRPEHQLLPSDTDELERLTARHDRITGGGRYGSRIGATVSITLPLLMPVVSLLVSQINQ